MKIFKGSRSRNCKVALFTKTYSGDVNRLKELFYSIQKYNQDNLPYYISAPFNDRSAIEQAIGTEGYTLLADENIRVARKQYSGWEHQMIIKLLAYKEIPADNFLILDSDARFIKPFFEKDFIAYDNIPYSIVHENKQIAEYEVALKGVDYNYNGYSKAVRAYRDLFGYKSSKIYDYGPNPHLWSRIVLEHFYENYINYHGLDIEEFCVSVKQQYGIHFRETLTYGEYLMAAKPIDIVPSGPLFKTYHWKEMVDFEKGSGLELEENIAKNYLGIIMQSKHT